MKLKTQSKYIDDLEITITQLPPIRAFKLLPKLGRVIGPAISEAMKNGKSGDSLLTLGPALALVSESELEPLMKELFSTARAKVPNPDRLVALNSDEAINEVFAGNLLMMVKALIFSVEVNYGSFFGGVASSDA